MPAALEWRFDDLVVTTDPARVDLDVVQGFLTTSYWSPGVPRDVLRRAIEHSLPFSAWRDGRQVGFARVVTDRATFAWLADVFVVPAERGRGISKRILEAVMAHPDLQGLRQFVLATRDAHGLYARHGFQPLAAPERWMHRWDPEVYRRPRG